MAEIVVVEDDRALGAVIRVILESAGHHVATFLDAESAVEYLDEGRPPDVLIADVCLPGMDGVSLGERVLLEPRFGRTKVILTSGRAKPGAVPDGWLFMRKPLDPDTLLDEVSRLAHR